MMIQPTFVHSAIRWRGSPIFGALSVFSFEYSPAPSIRCTGRRRFVSRSFIATPDSCGYLAIISWYLGLSRKSNSHLSTLVNSTGIENFLLTSVMSIIARFTYLVDVPSNMSIFRTSFFHLPLDTRSRSAANTKELPAPVSNRALHFIP